ncbi:extracellular solute-binding protein [Candidatus Uhrbacteria bacterium]|nr:extracellular solute-binding protein [Candidatus Uhrbacteria bacterium]
MSRSSSLTSYSLLVIVFSSLIFVGAMCTKEQPLSVKPVRLEYWHVFGHQEALNRIGAAFKERYPYVSINYRAFRQDEYERELVNALAAGKGPDLFELHDTWMGVHEDKVLPLPPALTIPVFQQEGVLSKEVVARPGKMQTITARQVRDLYVDVVAETVVRPPGSGAAGNIFGLPLALDTMVLYYNRDLLNAGGVSEPPRTWDELIGRDGAPGMIAKLTRYDARREVTQAAIALGGSYNIDRAPDILSLLMLQNGAQMTDPQGRPTIDQRPPGWAGEGYPALGALAFYADFADPAKEETYTWSANFPEAITAFANGKSAMALGYAYHLPLIRARAPRMNLGWVSVPQVSTEYKTNYANFWVTSVSKQSPAPNEAWAFILFAATERFATPTFNPPYLYATMAMRPVALRSLVDRQRADPAQEDMRIFAESVLTAKNWYRGKDPQGMEATLRQAIQFVVDGTKSSRDAIDYITQRTR